MTATQEIESVIDALSKTITELRETKAKLATAQDKSKADLEIKKTLALRISELQKELAEMQVKHAGELEHEKRKALALYGSFGPGSFNFGPIPTGQYLVHAPIFERRDDSLSLQQWRLIIPEMHFEFRIDRQMLNHCNSRFPYFLYSAARQVSKQHEERLYTDILSAMEHHLK